MTTLIASEHLQPPATDSPGDADERDGDVSAAQPSGGEPSSLDALAAQWWSALDAAQSALRAAGRYLGPQERSARGRRLVEERSMAVRELEGLAHDLRSHSSLLRLVASPSAGRQMLGLPSEVTACVFDLDGVLTTSARAHADAWSETFDAFLIERAERSDRPFIPFHRDHDYEDYLAGRPRLDGVRAFLASRGISLPEGRPDDPPDAATIHGLANRKNQALRRRLEHQGVAAFEGSRSYLEAARVLGMHRAVVSASANTVAILERAGLAGLIEECVDGNTMRTEHLLPRPAPDTLLAACRHLHVDPRQTVVFETTPAGISAARQAGVRLAIGVARNGHTQALRASDADAVVGDLSELFERRSPVGARR